MSVNVETVTFERPTSRDAHLSEDEPPYTVHGVALGAGDVTVGQSGIKKFWPADELRKAAATLQGKNLVEDHDNGSRGVVGKVTSAGFKEGVGVIYEAELFDEELADKIENSLLEVSIRGHHIDVDEMEEQADGAKVVENIRFENLSIVPSGAAPSNTIQSGEHDELSLAELTEFTADLESAELQEIEPGMWVKGDDIRGITIGQVEDGEIEVDIYEEQDGKWRSIGETEMVSTDSLEEWDVDEEEDIGPRKDDDSEDEDGESEDEEKAAAVNPPSFTEGTMVQWQVNPNMFGEVVHNPDDRNIVMVEVMERMDGEMKPTGHTLTAAPPDLMKMDNEQMTDVEDLESFNDYPEAASENAQMALDAREETSNPNDCGTEVGWRRANQLADNEAVSEEVVGKMSAFARHKKNSDQGEEGREDCGWMMWKAWGGDEGVEWAQRKMDSIEEENMSEELQETQVHRPEFSGTTESDWSKPALEDFDTDDLSEVADHFLVSVTGFPPENFTDLKLPVVEPNGNLNLSALQNAKARLSQTDGVSGDDADRVEGIINSLANEEFDADFSSEENSEEEVEEEIEEAEEETEEAADRIEGEEQPYNSEAEKDAAKSQSPERYPDETDDVEEEARRGRQRQRRVDDTGDERSVQEVGPAAISLDLIDKYLAMQGAHERDTVDDMLGWLFGATDLPMETVGDFRSAANTFMAETGETDSFHSMTVEQFRDWLRMQQGQRNEPRRDGLSQEDTTPVSVLTGDDLRHNDGKSEESETDLISTIENLTMTSNIEEQVDELESPVALEQSDLEELEEKADRFDEMADTLEDLKARTDVLDDVDRDQVEELAESDEPVVIESARYEALQGEAEQVAGVYASSLAEEVEVFDADELTDKFSIEELREKFEEHIGDPEEELASTEAEPRSGDVDEEELEESAEAEESDEDDEVAEMQEQLKDRMDVFGDD